MKKQCIQTPWLVDYVEGPARYMIGTPRTYSKPSTIERFNRWLLVGAIRHVLPSVLRLHCFGNRINHRLDVLEMELQGEITPESYDRIKAPSLARAQFDHERRLVVDASVAFWERALKYVLSPEYSPKTYNLRFGGVRFSWCHRMSLTGSACDDCDFFDGEWCGHAPFINKLQPEIADGLLEDDDLDVSFALMPKRKLADNIEAFIDVLKASR